MGAERRVNFFAGPLPHLEHLAALRRVTLILLRSCCSRRDREHGVALSVCLCVLLLHGMYVCMGHLEHLDAQQPTVSV